MLTIALPKGRLADESIELLVSKGLLFSKPPEESRELTYLDTKSNIRLLFVRSQDVPTYVEECAADAGIVGWDIIQEGGYDLMVVHDLGIGACRLSLAGKPDFHPLSKLSKVKVATKYTELTRKFFFAKGISCEVVKLYGSIELAPLVGLADCIVDLVSTGQTLKANGMKEIEVILESTARLVCNRSSFYNKREQVMDFVSRIQK
ncbi:ATP phosphoribosyltransferase [Leptospira sp. GIMC2001]|uniref:ATP phosphoribosyltransferase n=1 Tax=Leptospira sp. GIMC2001 TaxID=1513297 RepID=UPI002349266B|nr:ATP phosphoribosyltransferase [Leptospira sp. GIMC2001]WCL48716.1 ATP phosphoribosyltransferase [Leptospira sp. GIMC2001]